MKAVRLFACVLAMGLMVGCSSGSKSTQSVKSTQKTADSLGTVVKEIDKGIEQIDKTATAMNALVNTPADLPKQFSAYTSEVNKLESMAKKVAERNQAFRARAEEYIKKWEADAATIKSEDIRKISDERRAAVRERFEALKADTAEGREAFTPLMEELRDIEMYLSNDLTTGGVAACKSIADKANANAVQVKQALVKINAELAKIQAEISPKDVAK